MLASIVIPNYNYASYVGRAIESALGLDWPALEVIVVDDGSTDGSRAVIEAFGDRIRSIFQSNAGQLEACNTGFRHAQGDVIIFLDSDDELERTLLRELANVWRIGISKVQFQMAVIDAEGRATGNVLPQFGVATTPERIRGWVLAAGAYPTPPGSGNAYSRSFLEKIFPLRGSDRFSDTYCLAAAPLLGDVVTIAKPLVRYRVHGRNDGAMTEMAVERFGREVKRARLRFEYKRHIAETVGLKLDDAAFDRSLAVLPYRLASIRLCAESHPIEGDSAASVLLHLLRASTVPQGVTISARVALVLWGGVVAVAPRAVAEHLIRWRFVPGARPRALRRVLEWSHAIRPQQPAHS